MGHVLGAEKGNFLIRGAGADEAKGRPRRFNPVNPCRGGVPGVAQGRYYTRASAYVAYAAAPSIFNRILSADHGLFSTVRSKTLKKKTEE